MADLDDIKSRIDIVDLVSQYVQLKKTGANYKGLCPFHSEKTPSFIVSPEKQICHCFGCNKGGDIFSFTEQVEGVTFIEAMEILADRAGVKIDRKKMKNKDTKDEKEQYFQAQQWACEFFEEQLCESAEGKKVLDYLYRRGLKDETIKEFRLGFCPDKYDALYPVLLKKGVSREVLLKSGLVSSKNISAGEIYDKYRARLIFPIFDYLGRICGFGGRALKKEQMPKYLNSPENPIYNKSRVLYGLSHAKQSIRERGQVLLVEGYFDVILPYQGGFKNVVATSGTALTQDQVKLLKRLTPNVISCFDSDEAGFEATKRAYFVLQDADINLKTISDLGKKDPADYVRENGEKFAEIVGQSVDFVSFYMDRLISENRVNSAEGRKKIIGALLPCYKKMTLSIKDFYVRELASRVNMNEKYLYDEIENYSLPMDHPLKVQVDEVKTRFSLDEILLGILLEYPKLFSSAVEIIDFDFEDQLNDVYKALTAQYNALREKLNQWDFEDMFLAEYKSKIDVLRLYVEQKYQEFSEQTLNLELVKLVDRVKKDRKLKLLQELQTKIVEAEKEGNKEILTQLLTEQQKLLR